MSTLTGEQLATQIEELVGAPEIMPMVHKKNKANFWQFVHQEGIPHYRLSPKVIRFKKSEVQRWIESRRVGAVAA